jgi:hypothetical protein
MSEISYNVTCRVPGEGKAHEWLTWLQDEHINDVLKAGAISAEVIRFDDDGKPGILFQIRYKFNNRDAIEEYMKNYAPRLREDGLKKFPPEEGFLYDRSIGEIILMQK